MKPQPRYQPGDRIGGRYQVHKALLGGMGEVYLCLDLEGMQPYALKTFQQRYLTDTQRLRRAFEQEVATWVALEKHPNIVRCFYMTTLDNQPFMVLEWIASEEGRGTDLRSWLHRGPLALKLALEIALDLCHGLIHAQQKKPGLVHRDLKPENILMARGGLAKITDFGLAQIVKAAGLEAGSERAITDSRQSFIVGQGIAGTPAYMAPEQWLGEPLDERTDIYALGIILYELLMGRPPFMGTSMPTTIQQIQMWLQSMQAAHEAMPPPKLPSVLMPELDELLQRCLAKPPCGRPASLAALSVQLTQLYQQHFDQPPPARPTLGLFTSIDYSNRGATHHALQQYEQALADYDQAIDLDPTYAQAYANRGLTYASIQQYERALVDYGQAIDLNPNDAHAYANRGVTHADMQEYERALADFGQAIDLDPTLAQAHYNRGVTHHALQQYERALADFGRAIDLDPTLAQAHYNRGLTYAAMQEYEKALVDYGQAIDLDPTDARAYANRGNTHHALQQYERALADFGRAIDLDPTLTQAHYNRGLTHAAMQEYERALADFGQTIDLDPTDARAYANRGNTHHALLQYERALADYDLAIDLDPTLAQAHYNRGVTHHDLQEYERALVDYRRAIEIDPNYAHAYVNIGLLLDNQRRLEEALAYFEQAARLGEPIGAQYAAQARQRLEQEPTSPVAPARQAFAAFAEAGSLAAMQQAVARFPSLMQSDFIAAVEQIITQRVSPEDRPASEKRLGWLQQLVRQQK